MKDKYDVIDALFEKGLFYSRRLLINYYGNRLLFHTRFNEYDKAEFYGYLSISIKTSDYLHYVNNLSAILLRNKKNTEALSLMRQVHPEMKHTHSFHNKVGFMSFYGKCLLSIFLYNALCAYKEDLIAFKDLQKIITTEKKAFAERSDCSHQFDDLLKNMRHHLNEIDKGRLIVEAKGSIV